MSNGKSVEENLVSLIAKIGEKITIGKTKTIENTNCINFSYQHSVVKDNVSVPESDFAPDQSPEAVQEVALVVDQVIVTSSARYISGDEIDIVIDAEGIDGVDGSPPPPPPPQLAKNSGTRM